MSTIEEQIAAIKAENDKLRDEHIDILKRKIAALQYQLDSLILSKVAELRDANQSMYDYMEARRRRRKPSPLKGRKILEDYECAVSTAIRRLGGIKIPKNLKEEFGGWNRMHDDKALAVDEMACELHELGLIPEPTTNALLEGLKSGRKSARALADIRVIDYYDEEGRRIAAEQAAEESSECPF